MRYLILFMCLLSASSQEEVYGQYTGYWLNVIATAYSPQDPIDGTYHATKGKWRWITADGKTDVREEPYGIAVPLARSGGRKLNRPWLPFGTKIIIPTGYGYLDKTRSNDRIFSVDDVGNGKEYFATKRGRLHIDLRFKHHGSAIRWAGPGQREMRVFVVTGEIDQPQIRQEFVVTITPNLFSETIPIEIEQPAMATVAIETQVADNSFIEVVPSYNHNYVLIILMWILVLIYVSLIIIKRHRIQSH